MKYLFYISLFSCLMFKATAQNDTVHIKNTDSVFLQLEINWPGGWSILKDVKADTTIVMYSDKFKGGADLIITSPRGKFGSSMREVPTRGNYTLVIAWSEKQRAYRTIFRPYQDED